MWVSTTLTLRTGQNSVRPDGSTRNSNRKFPVRKVNNYFNWVFFISYINSRKLFRPSPLSLSSLIHKQPLEFLLIVVNFVHSRNEFTNFGNYGYVKWVDWVFVTYDKLISKNTLFLFLSLIFSNWMMEISPKKTHEIVEVDLDFIYVSMFHHSSFYDIYLKCEYISVLKFSFSNLTNFSSFINNSLSLISELLK